MNPSDSNPENRAWVAELDRQLRALPDHPAPPSLIAAVLARLEQQAHAPWWHQSWWAWPKPVQIASLLLSSAAIATLTLLVAAVGDAVVDSYLYAAWLECLAQCRSAGRTLATLGDATHSLLRQLPGAVLPTVTTVWLTFYLAVLALGTVLYRLSCPSLQSR